MKKFTLLVATLAILGMTAPAHALFTNGGFEDGTFNGWTIEHGENNLGGLTLSGSVPVSENVNYLPGGWDNNTFGGGSYTSGPLDNITSGTDNDYFVTILPQVRFGLHSAVVNYSGSGYNGFATNAGDYYRATRISQQDVVTGADRDPDGLFHIRFAWAAVLENPGHPQAQQPYVHVTLTNLTKETVLYSRFFYSNQPDVAWRSDNVTRGGVLWIDWQNEDLTFTDNEVLGDTLRIEASAAGCAQSGHFGHVYLDGFRSQASATGGGGTTFTLDRDGLGGGVILGNCGMVVGQDGKGKSGAVEEAGMIALYFGLLLLPVGILKLFHGRKRRPFEKGGIVALLIVASMLVASSAHAERLIAPKAQRFHPTTDGQGALTVDTDQTLCPGQFNVGLTLSGAKKPLDMGDIRELKIEKVVVDELYTADLLVAYGLTPDITLGLDVPYDFSRDNLNYAQHKLGNTGVRDDVFHLGDIRLNAKFRVIDGGRYGLALITFANFATGDRDYLLSEGKFGFGMKVAGHFDVTKPLTLYANLGAEHIGDIATPSSAPGYYAPWIQYGVGAKYLLPWRKDSIVAEINGETSMATPYAHSTLSPLEILAAYRTEVAPGWTLQAGGGGGLNKGMGAPQWRAILGVAYKM